MEILFESEKIVDKKDIKTGLKIFSLLYLNIYNDIIRM